MPETDAQELRQGAVSAPLEPPRPAGGGRRREFESHDRHHSLGSGPGLSTEGMTIVDMRQKRTSSFVSGSESGRSPDEVLWEAIVRASAVSLGGPRKCRSQTMDGRRGESP